jgi:threonylcarbamoyladenosine tRNA methylthiotransferase MtaB
VSIDVVTFGCRLNTYESEVIRRNAAAAGLGAGDVADVVIVNTCAVTGEAERQARQAIRRLKRERPQARIIVTGCAAQTSPDRFAAMEEVDRVVGNDAKMRVDPWTQAQDIFARVRDFGADAYEKIAVNDIMSVRETAAHLIEGIEGRARAYVQVQNGCDHRCTFCIIPFGRGNSRSVPMGEVVEEVRRLVDNGYREVVLTGVDLTSYGVDLPGTPKLGTLVRQLLKHVGLERLRLSSLDCIEIDAGLMDAFAEEERLMPHLHLSLQAGDDLILKRMKRRHARADAIALSRELRRRRPGIVFGADFIAGFPTETEDMFRRSLDLVEECGLTYLHVFPYSPRPGTPAARMPQVARQIVKDRARRLRRHGEAALRRHLDAEIGSVRSVLTESHNGGRSEHFTPVRFDRAVEPGIIVETRMIGHDGSRLIAAA